MDWARKGLLQSRQIGGEQMVHKVRYLPVLKRGGVLLIESSDNCISQSSSFTLVWKKEGVTLLPNYSEIFGLFLCSLNLFVILPLPLFQRPFF